LEKSLRGFTQVEKNGNLENGVRVQMHEFNLVVIKKSVKEITGREAKSALEEGREHHSVNCAGCTNIFPGGIQEKVICIKLADFTFIRNGWLEKIMVRGGHRGEERLQQHGIGASAKKEIAKKWWWRKESLGLGPNPLFKATIRRGT
jgi:hypothetical protein